MRSTWQICSGEACKADGTHRTYCLHAHIALKRRTPDDVSPLIMATLALDKCQLNPLGRASVKSHFLAKGFSRSFAPRLDSAALAFLVYGFHSDGKNAVERDRFHEDVEIGRAGCSPGSKENFTLRHDLFKLICDVVSHPFFTFHIVLIACHSVVRGTA